MKERGLWVGLVCLQDEDRQLAPRLLEVMVHPLTLTGH